MNPVLILTHDCLELTKRCVESVQKQDIPTNLLVYDNGSTDETVEWIANAGHCENGSIVTSSLWPSHSNDGVSKGWNFGLDTIFKWWIEKHHVLVLNNDTEIPPWFYRELLACEVPFVTGASSTDREAVAQPPVRSLTDGPDFSAFLIRREAWEKVGPFDETMVHYCSDVDYDIRARAAGLTLHNCHVKFYHERSSTLRLSADRDAIEERSHLDHLAFKAKYGCFPSELGWAAQ